MTEDIYQKLGERLNQFEGKNPLVDSYFKILREMYTEEEAVVAANFPQGLHTAGELAEKFKRDEAQMSELLEKMANNGQVFSCRSEKGDLTYELIPYVPGAIEYYILRRLDRPDEIKKIMDLSEKMREEAGGLMQQLMTEDPEKAMTMIPSEPHFRILTVNEALPPEKEVKSYEDVLKMIESQTSFSAMVCTCREGVGPNTTGPCKVEGVPDYSCLCFGRTADFLVDRNFAKRITKEDCKQILEACNEAGLVLNVNNFVDDLQFICNCCSCCCGVMKGVKAVGPLMGIESVVNAANFAPVIDGESCTGCQECESRCPVSAIAVKDDIAVLNPDMCLGCGNCLAVCPAESISMERIAEKSPVLGERKVGFGF